MNTRRACSALVVCLLLLALACGPGDPRAEVLTQRGRWTVELLSWIERDDGSVTASVRLSGPPTTKLDTLTFRVLLVGADDEELAAHWEVVPTSEIPRGAPKEIRVTVPGVPGLQGVAAGIVFDPTPEQATHIEELAGL